MNKVPTMKAVKTVHKMKKHSTANLFPAPKKFSAMKAFAIVTCMAFMLLTISGCGQQTKSPSDDQPAPVETDSPVPHDTSDTSRETFEEEAVQAETGAFGGTETTVSVETEKAAETAEREETTDTAVTAEISSAEADTIADTGITAAGTDMPAAEDNETEDQMRLLIGETEVPVTWKDNASVEALRALCPLTIHMSMYGGFEQVGPIGQSIARDDQQTDTSYGDIVLYSGNQIVIFYGSNSWAYTRLGHVDLSQKEMKDLLSNGDVDITLK